MNDKFDDFVSECFDEENIPSLKTRTVLHSKISELEQKKSTREVIFFTIGAMLFTLFLSGILLFFGGNIIFIYAVIFNLFFCAASGTIYIIVKKTERRTKKCL